MKKNLIISAVIFLGGLISCQKNNSDKITLSANTTTASVGQPVSFLVTTRASAVNWNVTPSVSATKLYAVTNEKSNTISFNHIGDYVVSVSARDLKIDSSFHKNADSCWHNHDRDHGRCEKGIDSTSITIAVK